MNRELNIVVMPDRALKLEWFETKENFTKSRKIIQEEIHDRFISEPESWLLFLGFCDKKIELSPSLSFFRKFTAFFTYKLSRTPDLELLRQNVDIPIEEHEIAPFVDSVPMVTGAEYINRDLLVDIWQNLNSSYVLLIKTYDGTVESFFKSYNPNVHIIGRIFFHLVENKESEFPFAFMATYSTGLNDKGKSRHLPLKHAITQYGDDSDKILDLLSTVHLAAEKSILISGLIETGELFHPIMWSANEAFRFLKEIPLYESSGILCRIPNWWDKKSRGATLNISMGDAKPSYVGMDAILNFNIRLFIGDMRITEKEARELLEASEGLAFIKNKWVAVDPDKLRQTLSAYDKAKLLMENEGLNIREALRMQLRPDKLIDAVEKNIDISVSRGKWLDSVLKKLRNPEKIPLVKPGKDFTAQLRSYQQKGLNWMFFLHSLGFGACLADDMGLGKTVQLLALLSVSKFRKEKRSNLLVIPASLISNWMDEIDRFIPSLNYFVAHPDMQPDKKVPAKNEKEIQSDTLIITTYALVQKYDWIKDYGWNYIILDEAQAIKNPGTKQTRAIKKLKSKNRIILTGTPVENRLSDLWSLFDFLNPGLLGNKSEFGKFSKTLRNQPQGYSRLRRLISPYILRRLKTDKSVISDLPEKVEMKIYAQLSKKQVVLYKNLVRELERKIEEAEGIQKKGLILSSLMKFKQLCNHPDQFLGTGDYEEKASGKFERLREICTIIYEKREKVLVFTQFKEMTGPLNTFLEEIFKREGLVLHGGVPVKKRKNIIETFQSDEYTPFMILSLKAGGVGLNLTKANHVIHFDRWWNPAVENQATDRAFRIGQKKNVVVHKFLTKGTIEEKIDQMIEAKKKLSADIITSTGESWITEMNNDELIELFNLNL